MAEILILVSGALAGAAVWICALLLARAALEAVAVRGDPEGLLLD